MTVSKNEQQWLARLDDLVAFRAEHGSWPRANGANLPKREKALGKWLNHQRTLNKRGDLTTERRNLLDTRVPGWDEGRDQQWFATLDDLEAFHVKHGAWPRQPNPGVPDAEGRLGSWLNTQRYASKRGDLTAERRNLLDTRAPRWEGEHVGLEQKWLSKLDDVVAFHTEHGTWPRQPWDGVPEREGTLGTWLTTQRKANTRGDLTTERRQLLDTRAPGWLLGNRKAPERRLTQDEKVHLLVTHGDAVLGDWLGRRT